MPEVDFRPVIHRIVAASSLNRRHQGRASAQRSSAVVSESSPRQPASLVRCQACDKRTESAWISVGPNSAADDQFDGFRRLRGVGFRFGRPDAAGG